MIKILLAILVLLQGCSTMEVATNALLVADWGQTRHIADNPDKYYERENIILNEHPSKNEVDNYFASVIAINTLLHKYLPKKYLPYYQTGLIAIEADCIANNYNLGIKINFGGK